MELRRILMAAALVTTVGGSSLLAESSARRTGGGGGCPNYSAFPSETCIDESQRVAWCLDKLSTYYPNQGCVPTSSGADHTCAQASQGYTINCKVAPS